MPSDYRVRNAGGRKRIINGPIYDLSVAQTLVHRHGLCVINDSANDDMVQAFDPALNEGDLVVIFGALRDDHYCESETCGTSVGMTIDADAYVIHWNRVKKCESQSNGRKIYLKFGFRDNLLKCLVVRVHPARY